MKKFLTWLYWWYWSGRYTKVKLWSAETISIDQGYFACKHKQHEIHSKYHIDINKLGMDRATELFNERYAKLERQYFGPKYIKD